jgi:hypothetical protein
VLSLIRQWLTWALPAKAGLITFALNGIATAPLEPQQRTAELARKDFANINGNRRIEKHSNRKEIDNFNKERRK